MRLSASLVPILGLILAFCPTHVFLSPSYFIINEPTKGVQWVNNVTSYVQWTTGLQQGIDAFDVELARLSTDGLLFVARNVPTTASALPIALVDVPPADDYFLLFLNSTHGVMYSMSERFAVLASGQTPSNNSAQTLDKNKSKNLLATVTVSGSPNPTSSFAYTFAPVAGARRAAGETWRAGTAVAGVAGCLWALW